MFGVSFRLRKIVSSGFYLNDGQRTLSGFSEKHALWKRISAPPGLAVAPENTQKMRISLVLLLAQQIASRRAPHIPTLGLEHLR
jgi:hypothetical protein